MNAHLLLEADALCPVARARRAIILQQEFRHQEQRYAARPRRCIRQARQHEVHDILGHIVVAPCDIDFLAADRIAAVFLRHGLGLQCTHIASRLRLGQVHRPRPGSGNQVWQVGHLQLIRAMRQKRIDGAETQHRTQGERHVRRMEHFHHRQREGLGQALTAPFLRRRQPHPAAIAERRIRLGKARRGLHAVLSQHHALRIAALV